MKRLWRQSLKLRQLRLDAVDGLDDVGARKLENRQQDGRLPVGPSPQLRVLCGIDGPRYVANADRTAIPIRDNLIVPRFGGQKLVVVIDRESSRCSLNCPLGCIRACRGDRGADVFERQPKSGELVRIDLNANGRLLLSEDQDLPYARNLADALEQDVLGEIVHLRERQSVGCERENEDRRIGRVHLAVGRRRRKIGRKLACRRIDRRLNILRRPVDVAA